MEVAGTVPLPIWQAGLKSVIPAGSGLKIQSELDLAHLKPLNLATEEWVCLASEKWYIGILYWEPYNHHEMEQLLAMSAKKDSATVVADEHSININ